MAQQLTVELKDLTLKIGKLSVHCDDQESLEEFLAGIGACVKSDTVSLSVQASEKNKANERNRHWVPKEVLNWPFPAEGNFRVFG